MPIYIYQKDDELYHHGIKGQKWGIRRYQNPDGSLTPEGKMRYSGKNGINNLVKDSTSIAGSKDPKAWAKTYKKLGIDPHEAIYYTKRGSSRRNAAYDILSKTFELEAPERAKEYKNNADEHEKSNYKHLEDYISENEPTLPKELGVKNTKEARKYLVEAMQKWSESDPDRVIEQHMEDIPNLYYDNLLDEASYRKHYNAQAADDAVDMIGYGYDAEAFKKAYETGRFW